MAGQRHGDAKRSVPKASFNRHLNDGLLTPRCQKREVMRIKGDSGPMDFFDEGEEGLPPEQFESRPGVTERIAGQESEVLPNHGSEEAIPPGMATPGACAIPRRYHDFG